MLRKLTLLVATIGILLVMAAPASQAQTIHQVVKATWPPGTRVAATQIAYHEGGGIVNDGYCGWGMLPSTQYLLNMNPYRMDNPYYCSRKAYRLYRWYGWSPWVTYGWYTPGAGRTPVTYY